MSFVLVASVSLAFADEKRFFDLLPLEKLAVICQVLVHLLHLVHLLFEKFLATKLDNSNKKSSKNSKQTRGRQTKRKQKASANFECSLTEGACNCELKLAVSLKLKCSDCNLIVTVIESSRFS